MAKQTKKAKPTKLRSKETPGVVINILPVPPPSQEDFKRARELLRRSADALVLDLAKRYAASKATELTTVLGANRASAAQEAICPRTSRAESRPLSRHKRASTGGRAMGKRPRLRRRAAARPPSTFRRPAERAQAHWSALPGLTAKTPSARA